MNHLLIPFSTVTVTERVNYIRINSNSTPFVNWNPWNHNSVDSIIERNQVDRENLLLKSSPSLCGLEKDDDEVVETSYPPHSACSVTKSHIPDISQLKESQSSPTSSVSTSIWVDEQAKMRDFSEIRESVLGLTKAEQLDPPSFYQRLKASIPNISIVGRSSVSLQKGSEFDTLSVSAANNSTRASSRLPPKARHQAVAINNIAKLFSDLLGEREQILQESEAIESSRIAAEFELYEIEQALTSYSDKKEKILDKISKKRMTEKKLNAAIESLDEIICSIGDQTVKTENYIRNLKGDSRVNEGVTTLFGHENSVECIDYEDSFGSMVSGSADKLIRIWDLSEKVCKGVLEGHEGWIRCIQKSGYNIVSGSGDHTAKLWDISCLEETGNILIDSDNDQDPLVKTFYGHEGGVTCLKFQDGKLLTGSVDKTIRYWDVETGKSTSTLCAYGKQNTTTSLDTLVYPDPRFPNDGFSSLLSNPDFAGWRDEQNIMGSTESKLMVSCGYVGGLHFWKHAVTAGYGDGLIRLFDLRTGQCHRTITHHSMAITALGVAFDENQIISASLDKTVKVWDLRMGQTMQSILTAGCISDMSFDHSRIAVASNSKTISIYSRQQGSISQVLSGHIKTVRSVKISPDGTGKILSGSRDGTVRIWQLDTT